MDGSGGLGAVSIGISERLAWLIVVRRFTHAARLIRERGSRRPRAAARELCSDSRSPFRSPAPTRRSRSSTQLTLDR